MNNNQKCEICEKNFEVIELPHTKSYKEYSYYLDLRSFQKSHTTCQECSERIGFRMRTYPQGKSDF